MASRFFTNFKVSCCRGWDSAGTVKEMLFSKACVGDFGISQVKLPFYLQTLDDLLGLKYEKNPPIRFKIAQIAI